MNDNQLFRSAAALGGPTKLKGSEQPTPMTTNNPELTPVQYQGVRPYVIHEVKYPGDKALWELCWESACGQVSITLEATSKEALISEWNALHTPQEPEWQPVDTMPNEGAFLVDLGDGQLSIVTLEGYKNVNLVNLVKGWMPLPNPASSKKEGDE